MKTLRKGCGSASSSQTRLPAPGAWSWLLRRGPQAAREAEPGATASPEQGSNQAGQPGLPPPSPAPNAGQGGDAPQGSCPLPIVGRTGPWGLQVTLPVGLGMRCLVQDEELGHLLRTHAALPCAHTLGPGGDMSVGHRGRTCPLVWDRI